MRWRRPRRRRRRRIEYIPAVTLLTPSVTSHNAQLGRDAVNYRTLVITAASQRHYRTLTPSSPPPPSLKQSPLLKVDGVAPALAVVLREVTR
ncbi:hypothetical protein NHX12_020685 [Muraenolepis orangiensis]|uniref:Uncharacterized protein n=1 Tax=Muraenolepis orangiensis TaxID=630683 RepID=A0A9Q0ESF4_9TELE|nr:hypothetical protein NHX12_020685 [Muraenolepis orangiensis]